MGLVITALLIPAAIALSQEGTILFKKCTNAQKHADNECSLSLFHISTRKVQDLGIESRATNDTCPPRYSTSVQMFIFELNKNATLGERYNDDLETKLRYEQIFRRYSYDEDEEVKFSVHGVYALNADGSGLRAVEKNEGHCPVPSLDGRKIAYIESFYRILRDGNVIFENNFDNMYYPDIKNMIFPNRLASSHDGSRYVFTTIVSHSSRDDVTPCSIYVINTNGGGLKKIFTFSGEVSATDVSWGPDDKYISAYINNDSMLRSRYFVPWEGSTDEVNGKALFVLDLESGRPAIRAKNFFRGEAIFSPDGRYLLAYARPDTSYPDHNLTIFNTRDGTSRVIKDTNQCKPLSWSADSRHIIFSSVDATRENGHRYKTSDYSSVRAYDTVTGASATLFIVPKDYYIEWAVPSF